MQWLVTQDLCRATRMPRVGLCLWNVADLASEVSQIPPSPFKVHEGTVGAYHDKRSGHWYVKYTGNKTCAGRVQIKHGTFVDARVAWATARWLASQPCATLLSAGNKADAFWESLCAVPSTRKRLLNDPTREEAKRQCVDASKQSTSGEVCEFWIEDVD